MVSIGDDDGVVVDQDVWIIIHVSMDLPVMFLSSTHELVLQYTMITPPTTVNDGVSLSSGTHCTHLEAVK